MFDTCKTRKSSSVCIDCWNLLYKHILLVCRIFTMAPYQKNQFSWGYHSVNIVAIEV
ncbi:unnamed protein product, partial [Brassica oleracea]